VRRRFGILFIALVLVATAACGGGGGSSDSSAPGSGSKRGSASPSKRKINGPGCQFIVAGTEKRFTKQLPDTQFLQSAVAEATTCYDKITFTFDPGDGPDLPPGYTVEYRKAPFGYEGIANSTAGFKESKAVLAVEIQPASTTDTRNPGRSIETYKGNLRLQLGKDIRHTVIVEWLSKIVDLTPEDPTDDKVVWLIGLDSKLPFTVDAYNQPPRVSVLIMH
jgi:hypothetical protein